MRRCSLHALLTLAMLAASVSMGWAQSYRFEVLDFPDANYTVAEGINDSGHVVGGYGDAAFGTHGFVYKSGGFATLDSPDNSAILALGINNKDHVVGTLVADEQQGFLYTEKRNRKSFLPIVVPFETEVFLTRANGINNRGQIVGEYLDNASNSQQHGFIYDNGDFSSLDVPGASACSATGINDRGQVVGFYEDAAGVHGFLSDGETIVPIDVSDTDASSTSALGVNNDGDIVGMYQDGSGTHGFILKQQIFSSIDVPGAVQTVVLGINRRGQIAGFYSDNTGVHGFIGTPVKAPKVAKR
jgi:probable HAF family extracellular repeat protein